VGLARTSDEVSWVPSGSLFAAADGKKGWRGGGRYGAGARWRRRGRGPGGRQQPGAAEAGAARAARAGELRQGRWRH
jgi:hypothetical protein